MTAHAGGVRPKRTAMGTLDAPLRSLREEALQQVPLERAGEDDGWETAGRPAAAPASPARRGRRAGVAALCVLAIACAAAAFAAWAPAGAARFAGLDFLALKRLDMRGDTAKVPLARLKEAVEPVIAGKTYFSADLAAARAAAESVPWVRSAAVRRIWPDRLEIDVTVREAVAQFEDGRLVSDEGVLFSANPDEGSEGGTLPSFAGGADDVSEILRRCRRFTTLLAALPVRVTEVALSDRGGWSVTFQGPAIPPTRVELGREAAGSSVEERLRQVVAAYPSISEVLDGPPSSIDARYRGAIAAGKVDREGLAAYLAENARPQEAAGQADAESAEGADGAESAESAGSPEGAGGDGSADEASAQSAQSGDNASGAGARSAGASSPSTP